MNRIYFVRHGENEANVKQVFSCKNVDYSLTEKGVLQARQTAEYFARLGIPIHAIYSSPLKRAVETAQAIADPLGLEVMVKEQFTEIQIGVYEGESFADFSDQYFGTIQKWYDGKVTVIFPGGENFLMLWQRMREGLEQVLAGREDQNIIIVAHVGLFKATLKELCPGSNVEWYRQFPYYNCAVTEVIVGDGAARVHGSSLAGKLVRWAEIDHLSGEAIPTTDR